MKTLQNNRFYDAAVFDLDGTLLDTLPDLTYAVNAALSYSGHKKVSGADMHSFIGNGTFTLIGRALGKDCNEETCIKTHKKFLEIYGDHLFDRTKPYDGIKDLLIFLRGQGMKIAVVSNKDDAFSKALISRFFGSLVDITKGTVKMEERKPDPSVTLSVLDSFGVAPERAVFVGDGLTDMMTSKAAGTDFIPVGYGYNDPKLLFEKSGIIPVMNVSELKDRFPSMW